MKNTIFCFVTALLSIVSVKAQGFQGVATYESKTSLGDEMKRMDGNKDITPEVRKMIEEKMKQMFEKTFILRFDKTASIYEEQEKLDAPGQENSPFKMMSSLMGGGGKQYKNIKDKTILMEKDIFGKEFLVSDTLPVIKWKMESETKKIGNYTCYKATAVVPADKTNLMNFKPKKDAEKKVEEDQKANKTTNFMDVVEAPKETTLTAWYSPEIPISQGPGNYWGLPGLILEVSDGKTLLLCSKVVINPKEKVEIKAPTKGTKVTQAEFADIMMKKIQEMQEMYQQGGGKGGRMRIGG